MAYEPKPRWTNKQTLFIEQNYEKLTDEQIATALGRTKKSIRRKRERLLLKKASGRGYCKRFVKETPNSEVLPQ